MPLCQKKLLKIFRYSSKPRFKKSFAVWRRLVFCIAEARSAQRRHGLHSGGTVCKVEVWSAQQRLMASGRSLSRITLVGRVYAPQQTNYTYSYYTNQTNQTAKTATQAINVLSNNTTDKIRRIMKIRHSAIFSRKDV